MQECLGLRIVNSVNSVLLNKICGCDDKRKQSWWMVCGDVTCFMSVTAALYGDGVVLCCALKKHKDNVACGLQHTATVE